MRAERLDDLNRNGFRLIQYPEKFCFGTDAVLLADFARAGKRDRVMDLGTGNGIIPVLLAARGKGRSVLGVDIDAEHVELAKRNAELNGIESFVTFQAADVRDCAKTAAFDVVCANPPYLRENGTDAARYELNGSFGDFCRAADNSLRFGGRFYVVHRADRVVDVLAELKNHRLEPKRLRFVAPFAGREPVLLLVEAAKGGKPGCRVMGELVLHEQDGSYGEEARKIYYG